MPRVTITLAGRAPLADRFRLSRIDRDIRLAPDNASIPALSDPPLLRRILGNKTRWLKRPSGKSREETPLGASGRRERRKHASSYLMQSFAYFAKPIRFLETHDPYSTPRATAFNGVQAAEAV